MNDRDTAGDVQQADMNPITEISVTESCGNIFADMGLPNAEERLAKAELSLQIEDLIRRRGLTQTQAAKIMGLEQPDVSHIVHGRLTDFTLDRLFACLNALDQDIESRVYPKPAANLS